MPTRIAKSFTFDAAHRLPAVPPEHPCARLHGHTYTVTVTLEGEPDARSGWLMDFGEIGRACRPLVDQLDHVCLNDLPGLENPTSERLARWLYDRLAPLLPGLCQVSVQETPTSSASYRP